ncbi:hypothetical protein MMC07_002508 [Pseudocyphellaria aurata]|nr:hypothetical protein [Pseudocyphellaria aurata]
MSLGYDRSWQPNPPPFHEMSNFDGSAPKNPNIATTTEWSYGGYSAYREGPHQQGANASNQFRRTWISRLLPEYFTSPKPYSAVDQYASSKPQPGPAQFFKHNSIEPIDSWTIHWFTPASMIFLLLIGLGSAVGHHIYYSSLDKQHAGSAAQQQWVTRIGTALAFLTQATLAAAVLISRNQRVWVSLREKYLSLHAIDALFSVTDNFFHFGNGEMIAHAKTATMMALVRWIIPLAAIFTPGTISVMSTVELNTTSCMAPTLRFPYEQVNSSHLVNSSATISTLGENWRFIYRSPSALAKKIFTLSAYSGNIAAGVPDAEGTTLKQDCSANCTYAISFDGPTLNCTEEIPWDSGRAPWRHELSFLPKIDSYGYKYVMAALGTDFTSMRGDSPENSTANSTMSIPDVLWVGHRLRLSDDFTLPPEKMYEPHVYSCQNSVGRYRVSAEVRDGRIVPTIDSVETLYGLPHESNYLMTTDEFTPNYALIDVLTSILGGNATIEPNGPSGSYAQLSTAETSVGSTPLTVHVNGSELRTVPHLGAEVEKMAHGMVASLLADRTLIYAASVNSSCSSSRAYNVYHYNAHTLIVVYAATVALAVYMVCLGALALLRNGVAHDTSFSTFVATTRNERLDRLFRGACLGKNPLGNDLGKTKMMFGEQQEPLSMAAGGAAMGRYHQNAEQTVGHATFGTEGGVRRLKKGGQYS